MEATHIRRIQLNSPSRITCDVTLNEIIADQHTLLNGPTQFLGPALGDPSEYGPPSIESTRCLSRHGTW